MNQKSIWAIIITVIITAVIVGGGVYAWQRSNSKSNEQALQQQITSLENQINQTLNTNVFTDWKTYEGLGFVIDYPIAWIIDRSYESEGVIWLRTKSRQADIDTKKMTRIFDVEVKVYSTVAELPNNDQDKLSFENWINKKADEYGFVERSTIIVDGVKGYKGVARGETYGNYLQFVENNGKIYQTEIEGATTEEKTNIVKSFKFIK